MDEITYQKVYKKLIRKFTFASLILLTVFLANQGFIQYQMKQEKDIANIMNIAGRQRMLSQKIIKDILFIREGYPALDVSFYVEEVKESIALWETSHDGLMKLKESRTSYFKDKSEITKMLKDVEPELKSIVENTKTILNELEKVEPNISQLKLLLIEITISGEVYLKEMNEIVEKYAEEANESFHYIERIHLILFFLTIIILIYIIIKIFNPILIYLKNAFWNTNESNKNLRKMFDSMRGAFFVVKEDGEILFLNEKGEELIHKEKKDAAIRFISKDINWLGYNVLDLIEEVKKENSKIDNIETKVKDGEGNILSVILSAVDGNYERNDVVMIDVFDVTTQKKAEEILRDAVIKDELTGLYNRYFLSKIIEEEIERSQRYNIPLSGALLDLDFFKHINDKWGHPVGDTVLKFTAEIICENIRKTDFPIRIGGEEFLILMPNTNLDGAMAAAEKIRKSIESKTHAIVGKYTASIGVAERQSDESYLELYKRIDEALYEAKANGRNCVVESKVLGLTGSSISLKWNRNWESGEKNIDKQHLELFRLVNRFANQSSAIENKDKEKGLLNAIIDHVIIHFEYEEKVLEEIGYHDFYNHKEIHSELLDKSIEVKEAFEKGEMDFLKVFTFVFDEVIMGHLLSEDVKFFSYFRSKEN